MTTQTILPVDAERLSELSHSNRRTGLAERKPLEGTRIGDYSDTA